MTSKSCCYRKLHLSLHDSFLTLMIRIGQMLLAYEQHTKFNNFSISNNHPLKLTFHYTTLTDNINKFQYIIMLKK